MSDQRYSLERIGQTLRGMIYDVRDNSTAKIMFRGTRTECIDWKRQHGDDK